MASENTEKMMGRKESDPRLAGFKYGVISGVFYVKFQGV